MEQLNYVDAASTSDSGNSSAIDKVSMPSNLFSKLFEEYLMYRKVNLRLLTV